ncbi:beta-lactamase family protein [Mariannaea sp. PMI_226]|nr:beta-lactamase family protein [Mariannaea sp. PMI_226]
MIASHKALLLLSFPSLAWTALDCRPEGPIFPRPTSLSSSSVFQKAASDLSNALDAAMSGSIDAGWPVENSSFSLAVISWDQEDAAVPVWEYHHLSEANTQGTKQLDRDSQYLIGSISKVATVYLLIKSGIDLDASVTEFLPSLNESSSSISWNNVTVRMLASYLSGLPTNYGLSEPYYLRDTFVKLGLPPIEDSKYPPCGVLGLNKECSDQQFLDGISNLYPITAPMERPVYSNSAFNILGMVLKEYTGKNYTQLMENWISKPLNLQNTIPSPGNDEKAVIPPGQSSWGSNYGPSTPAGGLVSSISDLTKFSHGLLSRTLDLTPTQINQWLKPASFAGGPYTMSGMPWEIIRPFNVTPEHPHPISIFGKSGGAVGYRSQLSFFNDYGIAVLILTAGDMKAAPFLTDAMLATFLPAVDEVSRTQAKQYERTFTSEKAAQAPIEASFSQDNESLVLSSLYRNGSDIASALHELWTLAMGDYMPKLGEMIRVFPSDLVSQNTTMDKELVTREVWHLWPEVIAGSKTDLPGSELEDHICVNWMNEDWVRYGSEPLDRILLYKDEAGDVVGLEFPFLRSGVLVPKSKPAAPKAPANTLVIDNGADTLKAGLVCDGKVGEPRVIPNCIARDNARKVYVASELSKCRDFQEIQFRRPVEKGFVVNWEAQKEIWDHEFFDKNATTKCDPLETRLILGVPPNGLPVIDTNCDQMVFEEFGFASYYRGIGPTFNAYHDIQSTFQTPKDVPTVANTPAEAIMVIDSGYSHTTITPLLQGRPLQSAIRRLDVGGKVLTNYLTRLISLRHFDMRNDTYIVNEMKELACYVSTDFRSDLEKSWKGTKGERRPDFISGGGIAKDYVLPDFHGRSKGIIREYDPTRHSKARKGAVPSEEDALTLRNERFSVPELIFSPSDAGIPQPGLADLIQESLGELPIGLWPSMLANIVVVGGNALFDGFIQRLQREVVQRVPDDCVVRVARPANPITNTWHGGANLANHAHINKLAVTKQEYEENGSAWVARKFNAGLGV